MNSAQKRKLHDGIHNLEEESRSKHPYNTRAAAAALSSADQVPGSSSSNGNNNGASVVLNANIPISNQFDGLEEEQGDDSISLRSIIKPPPVLKIGEPAKSKKVRVPPISVVGKSTRQLREFLGKCRIQQTAFNMKVTKTGVQLLCSSEESFSSAVAALRGDNVQFHTYTPAAEQPVKVVLSGLPVYDEFELETELAVLGIHVQS